MVLEAKRRADGELEYIGGSEGRAKPAPKVEVVKGEDFDYVQTVEAEPAPRKRRGPKPKAEEATPIKHEPESEPEQIELTVPIKELTAARKAWDAFEGSLRKSLSHAIELGKRLVLLKAKVPHGEFGRYFSDHDEPTDGALPFNRKWAHRLMTISCNEAVSNVHHDGHLPSDLNTVYELSLLTAPALEAAIEEGKVTPNTTREQAKALRKEVDPPKPRRERADSPTDPIIDADELEDSIRAAIDSYLKKQPESRGLVADILKHIAKEFVK